MKWLSLLLLIALNVYANDKTEVSLDPVPTITLPEQPIETPDVGAEK